MLFGEQFGRRHQCDLAAIGQHARSGHCGDCGFSRADIALQQSQHWLTAFQIGFDLTDHALLRAGQCEAESRAEGGGQWPSHWAAMRREFPRRHP